MPKDFLTQIVREFDRQFGEINVNEVGDVRSFLESSLNRAYEEGRRDAVEFIDSDEMKIEEGMHYGPEIDITELPEGLMAELTGIKKGWEAAKKQIRKFLLTPPKE